MDHIATNSHHQAGAALVVSLLFLLVLTLIGISAMQSTSLEEKMAGNQRDRDLSFQAAESALRHAEDRIKVNGGVLPFNCTTTGDTDPGLFAAACGPSNSPSTNDFWQTTDKATYNGGTLANLSGTPNYAIEQVYGDTMNVGTELVQEEYFRVTVRAVGGTSTAVTILQSVFRP